MTTALTKISEQEVQMNAQIQAYQMLKCFEDYERIGKSLSVTFGLNSPHHGTIMMLTAASENLSISQYHKRYHPDGTMRASAIHASYIDRGGSIEWVNLGDDGRVASANFSHPRLMPKPVLIQYTIEDARRQVGSKKMDAEGSNWKTNPGAMLRAALARKAVKIIDPGTVTGYDAFNDLDSDSPATVVVMSKEATEERRKELLNSMNGPVAGLEEPVVDVAVEAKAKDPEKSKSKPKPKPKPKPEAEPEPVASAAEPATEPAAEPAAEASSPSSGSHEPCTVEQLHALADLGQRLPIPASDGKPRRFMDLREVMAGICKAASVAQPKDMSFTVAQALIERWEKVAVKKE